MAEPNLTESAWQRAKVDAAGVYRTTTFHVGGTLLAAILSALTLIAQEGQPITTQAAMIVLGAAVAALLSVVIVFACQLAAAPVRQRNELRSAWETPPVKTVNIDLTLRNAFRKGNDLAKRLEDAHTYTMDDFHAAELWADEVVEMLAGKVPDAATRDFLAAGSAERSAPKRLRQRVTVLSRIIEERAG